MSNESALELMALPSVTPAFEPACRRQVGERLMRQSAISRYDAFLIPAFSIMNRETGFRLQVSCR